MEIEKYLLDKGIKPHYRGFKQLAYAIELCQKNEKYLQGFTKWLYPDIARDLNISQRQVERNIRDAIKFSGFEQSISEFIWRSIIEMKINKLKEKKKNGV